MRQKVNIADIFPKYLFWDMDYNKLDIIKDKAVIIPRALYATTPDTFESDIVLLESLYSSSDIIKYLKQTTENISNNVCKSVAKRYNVEAFSRFAL
ncbi:DUF6922 domain-containing protein [Flavobacterium poyangense]|uniref:DUF6922 domain-containing protein n=1 Tax=Flavobacterium poyangense TaxID=2204302 RepID=UPI00141E91D1|nr:hypothetical protein [Flavobacterium sp. JXAS1]